MSFSWRPQRASRPRDQWGQFRSKADIAREQNEARFESLQVGNEELYWQAQEEAEEDF